MMQSCVFNKAEYCYLIVYVTLYHRAGCYVGHSRRVTSYSVYLTASTVTSKSSPSKISTRKWSRFRQMPSYRSALSFA